MGYHKMAHQENQALRTKIIAQKKLSAKQARQQENGSRSTMQKEAT
jgi:hypothetical protein